MTISVYSTLDQNSSTLISSDWMVPLFSRVGDCGIAAARTYLAIRGLDTKGKGYLEFKVKDLAEALGVRPCTVYRALHEPIFFSAVSRGDGGRRIVSYRALTKVCADLGIDDLGAITLVPLSVIGARMKCACAATDSEFQMGQQQAYWTQTRGKTRAEKEKIFHAEVAATIESKKERVITKRNQNSVQCANGDKLVVGSFRRFRIRFDQQVPGISQQTIATRQGRSKRTISNRTSNKKRDRWGVLPLDRRRVIREFEEHIAAAVQHHLQADLHSNYGVIRKGDRLIQVGILKIGNEPPKAYELLTNVYAFSEVLLKRRSLRKRIKQFFKYQKQSSGYAA